MIICTEAKILELFHGNPAKWVNLLLKSKKFEFMLSDGHLTSKKNWNYQYAYFLKDHLGNSAATFTDANNDGTPEILTKDHYYPFGLTMPDLSYHASGKSNMLKYNGNEKQDDHGLEWYDYGDRFYDPQLVRCFNVDPSSEKYESWSPYINVKNNPLYYFDPDGKEGSPFFLIRPKDFSIQAIANKKVTKHLKKGETPLNAILRGQFEACLFHLSPFVILGTAMTGTELLLPIVSEGSSELLLLAQVTP